MMFLIAILFREENTQNMFVVFFAKGVADKEENQRSADTDNYLVQVKEFDLQRHSGAVGEYAASHSENGAGAVGFFPEQAKEQDPEESCFQAAESEHIYFPDNTGRGNGDKVNAKAKDNGSAHTEQTYRIIGNCFMTFGAFVHVYVFDDSGRGGQQQGRHGRNSCCDRADDGDAGPKWVHGADDSKRGDVIDAAAVSLQGICKHAFGKDADPGCDQGHGADNYGADDHSVMQGFGVFVADAADY